MITDRDACMAAYTTGRPLSDLPVSTAMSATLFDCGPEDSLAVVEETMRAHQVRRLPVLDRDRRVVGIVTMNDLLRAPDRYGRDVVKPDMLVTTLSAISRPRIGQSPMQAAAE